MIVIVIVIVMMKMLMLMLNSRLGEDHQLFIEKWDTVKKGEHRECCRFVAEHEAKQ